MARRRGYLSSRQKNGNKRKSTQPLLDPWLLSTREGVAASEGDVLAPLLSVIGEADAETIGSQEASYVQGRIPGIILKKTVGNTRQGIDNLFIIKYRR
jgi:hypothetical protein